MKEKKDYKDVIKELGIDETYTKAPKKGTFDTIKENTFPKQDYNFMADLLMLPKTSKGFRYILSVVDLWSDDFDIEPMKTKTSTECLKAFQTIINRDYLNMPKGSIRTDNGGEFKADFSKFLKDNNVLHRLSLPYRHKQMANVENLNLQLGRILMTYLSNKEQELEKPYYDWTDILEPIRVELNQYRHKPDGDPYSLDPIPFNDKEPLFKKGDIVIKKLEYPKNALGHTEDTERFRKGDLRWDYKTKLKIVKILNYPKNNRYILNTLPNVSYSENELQKVDDSDEKFEVKKIWDKKTIGKRVYYRVWWKKFLKKNSTWELKTNLIEDGLQEMIDEFESTL